MRNLERWIGAICRKIARQMSEGKTGPFSVDAAQLEELLEPPRFRTEALLGEDEVGVATGLAWTPAGGDVLFVEAAIVPGKGELTLTGHLGDGDAGVRPGRADLCAGARLPAWHRRDFYQKYDVHIHVPAGAIPKDGPSAGITIATALIFGADATTRQQACGDDRGDHLERARAADRRRQREGAGGATRGGAHGYPPQG